MHTTAATDRHGQESSAPYYAKSLPTYAVQVPHYAVGPPSSHRQPVLTADERKQILLENNK